MYAVGHSLTTVNAKLKNGEYKLPELIEKLECNDRIKYIYNNFGSKEDKEWRDAHRKQKSTRGRRKAVKPASTRKKQGNGTSFNSQTSFEILGKCVVRISEWDDKKYDTFNVEEARTLPGFSYVKIGEESKYKIVDKLYNVKIFQNGAVTCAGSLVENFADAQSIIEYLAKYLSQRLNRDISISTIGAVLKNYKTRLLNDYNIDNDKLYEYCKKTLSVTIPTTIERIYSLILTPILEGYKINPYYAGWKAFLDSDMIQSNREQLVDILDLDYNWDEFKVKLQELIKGEKRSDLENVRVNFNELKELITESDFITDYIQFIKFMNHILETKNMQFNSSIMLTIMENYVKGKLQNLKTALLLNQNNEVNNVSYNSDKYSGLTLTRRIIDLNSESRVVTVKIFRSGKINIDNAGSSNNAERIYIWLKKIFDENPDIIITQNRPDPEHDSDYD